RSLLLPLILSSFLLTAAKTSLAKSLSRHPDRTVHQFHRRASNPRFASARSRGERDVNRIQQEELTEVPFDDYYCPGHDWHSNAHAAKDALNLRHTSGSDARSPR